MTNGRAAARAWPSAREQTALLLTQCVCETLYRCAAGHQGYMHFPPTHNVPDSSPAHAVSPRSACLYPPDHPSLLTPDWTALASDFHPPLHPP